MEVLRVNFLNGENDNLVRIIEDGVKFEDNISVSLLIFLFLVLIFS